MTLMSFWFFVLLCTAVAAYYLLPTRLQPYVLLAASIVFFEAASGSRWVYMSVIVVCIIGVTYVCALVTDGLTGGMRTLSVTVGIILLIGILIRLKYLYNLFVLFGSAVHSATDFSYLSVAAPIGISYFTLSVTGYLLEVYWGNIQPERNAAYVALFILFFPAIVSGPVMRYRDMREKYGRGYTYDNERMARGITRMLWGYFQKLVISERFAAVCDTLYGDYLNYSGAALILGTLCYAVRLYTDFSGCMDIIMGAAQLFGVELPENFRAPFFCRTIQEFWQRWHITLGLWFKDYLLYPLQLTAPFIAVGRTARKLLGKKTGRRVSFYLSMLVLWFAIGLWHGGTAYFMLASGVIPCICLILSDILSPALGRLTEILHINVKNPLFRMWESVRTVMLVCIGLSVICAGSVSTALGVWRRIFTGFIGAGYAPLTTALFGLSGIDIALMLAGLLALYTVDRLRDRGEDVFDGLIASPAIVRLGVPLAAVFLIMYCGRVGSSSFIYFQF